MKRLNDTIIHDQATGPVPDGTPAPEAAPAIDPAPDLVAGPETAAPEVPAPSSGRRRPRTTSEE